jgi:hypothetical protein
LRIPLLTLRNTNNGAAGGSDDVHSAGRGERSGGARSWHRAAKHGSDMVGRDGVASARSGTAERDRDPLDRGGGAHDGHGVARRSRDVVDGDGAAGDTVDA